MSVPAGSPPAPQCLCPGGAEGTGPAGSYASTLVPVVSGLGLKCGDRGR